MTWRRAGPRAVALLTTLGLVLAAPARAQDSSAATDARPRGALRVFVDCAGFSCDDDYLRTELAFVDHVRDRQAAQVLVLVTTQPTGAGGTEFTASFIGQHEFRGATDSLRYVTRADDTPYDVRGGLAELLKRGLVRYVNHTAFGERLRIAYAPRTPNQEATAAPRDRWNAWSFRTTLNGSLNGERSYSFVGLNASFAADRTTEAWKVNTSLQIGYSENRVEVSGMPAITTVSRDYGLNALVVRSVDSHWSAGARATLTSSTFLNQSLAFRLAPALEYNVFPYAQSTRRQLTVQYSVGMTAFDYAQETIFGKTSETFVDQKLVASLAVIQPWGSAAMSLEGSYYLPDLSKRRGVAVGNIDLHLFGGFSLLLLGGLELVHDQLYLPKQEASDEEVLLEQRQLATSFRYWSSIGFSYTFGSPFANVVNPRFAGSSGGTSIVR